MVTHETYRSTDGAWLSPEEVKFDGDAVTTLDGAPVERGRIEKMSKSKKNVVDPDPMFDQYGADAVRWFMLSDSPPERDLEWSESGIEGTWRFVNRVWRLVNPPRNGEGDRREAGVEGHDEDVPLSKTQENSGVGGAPPSRGAPPPYGGGG